MEPATLGLPGTLRKMMTAMADTEKENPSLWGMGIVGVTVAVHFLHSLAQRELCVMTRDVYEGELSPALLSLPVSCLQLVAIFSAFHVSGVNLRVPSSLRQTLVTGLVAYSLGLPLLNLLLWSDDSSLAACYGVLEPVLCMLLLYVTARIPTESNKAGAVACFCFGALLLSGKIHLVGGIMGLLRVLCSVFLLVRNLTVKHMYDSNVNFTPRPQNTLLALTAGGTVVVVLAVSLMSVDLVVSALMAVVCAVLAVTLIYLLLCLLSLYDALTVAVFVLWAQVLENVVLVAEGSRSALLVVLLGSLLFALGHYVFFKDGLESGAVHLNIKLVGVTELLTRLQYVLCGGVILGLMAMIVQPDLDLNLLQLDNDDQ